ncbi:MAG: winged helix-turn-helix transcriptional regulator [Candidatus Bathyarchaeota archaeon]|nr:winged helix-turn-helix transcriptional regulator [Candidatus Bathyarchaeota archaeon]
MGFKKATVASLLIIILVICFAATLHQQKNFVLTSNSQNQPVKKLHTYSVADSLHLFGFEKPLFFAVTSTFSIPTHNGFADAAVAFNTTRMQIYNFVNQNPGVSFRVLCAGLCVPVGLAQYHLGVLVRAGLVSFVRDGRYKRFFISKRFSKKEMTWISLLRHGTARRIVEVLLRRKRLSHGRLADEVAVSSQALTWQMKRLRDCGFVLQTSEGLKIIYELDETSTAQLGDCVSIVKSVPA